jgi:hypothetical protein
MKIGSSDVAVHGWRAILLVGALEVLSGDKVLDSPLDETHFGLEVSCQLCQYLGDELRMAQFLPGSRVIIVSKYDPDELDGHRICVMGPPYFMILTTAASTT